MRHGSCLCAAGVGWHAPLLGSSGDQHGAGGGSGFAQRVVGADGAAAAAGAQANAFEARNGRRLNQLNLRPVHFELVGQHHGERGAHALAHLGARDPKANDIVGTDLDVGVGREVSGLGCGGKGAAIDCQDESGASDRLQEGATRGAHDCLPWVAAR